MVTNKQWTIRDMGGRVFNVVNFDHKSNTNMTVYPGMSEWLLFNAIKWEQVTFWW
jgi:hypothetical protein